MIYGIATDSDEEGNTYTTKVSVDAATRTITASYYDLDGKVKMDEKYTFDVDGNLIVEAYTYYADPEYNKRYEYAYDASGNLITQAHYDATGAKTFEYKYTYDNKGNNTSATCHKLDGSISYQSKCEYDANGNMTRKADYSNGALEGETKYEYDAAGKLTREADYSNGALEGETKYEYDAAGKLTRKADYYDGVLTGETKYDAAGNMISDEYINHGGIIAGYKDVFTYNNAGDLASISIFDEDGNLEEKVEYTNEQVVPFTIKDPDSVRIFDRFSL
jgi:antitoxin component YwqK of YwqJK toxin-antitoxin module